MAAIRLQGLLKSYGPEVVVNGVDLAIEEGEFVVLLGPSGCGKTTILRMIAGLEKVTEGEIWIGGKLMNSEPPDRRNIGMVFQNYALYPHMTVAGNLGFGLAARRRDRSSHGRTAGRTARLEERRRIQDTAKLLEIDHLLSRRPKELSGGQRQRVALGRAIIRKPAVFLMDEPLSNLDANLRDRMRLEIARLHQKLRITTVYVTHDQSEALTLADRIVVMHEGSIHQVGDAATVYDTPADTFVARFLGSPGMNLWTLPIEEAGDTVILGGSLRLPAALLPPPVKAGEMVTIGIRPEHFAIVSTRAGDPATAHGGHADHGESADDRCLAGEAVLSCHVDFLEHMGSHLLVHGSFGDGNPVIARLDAKAPVQRGGRIELAASAVRTHLFDAATGDRLARRAAGQQVGVLT